MPLALWPKRRNNGNHPANRLTRLHPAVEETVVFHPRMDRTNDFVVPWKERID